MKKLVFLSLFAILIADSQHLIFNRIVILPDNAELISIYNPTESTISLEDYYISDSNDYYKIQTENDNSPGSFINDFMAKFPDATEITSGDSLILTLRSDYQEFYGEDFTADLVLMEDMLETESNSFGFSTNDRLDDAQECLVLFYWNGNPDLPVQDVDYFVWGYATEAVDKSNVEGYLEDTPPEEQDIFNTIHDENYSFYRTEYVENEEEGGNGISTHDETSELLNTTWVKTFSPEFVFGCTDPNAMNYNPEAMIDVNPDSEISLDLLCYLPISDIVVENLYQIGQSVEIMGRVVDFFDVREVSASGTGPQNITIEDSEGYQVTLTVWDWEVFESSLNFIISEYYSEHYYLWANGTVDFYDAYEEWQVEIENEEDIKVVKILSSTGVETQTQDIQPVLIQPAPFVIIPSNGETLDFRFSYPHNSRVIIRIFDLSGKIVTSLVDQYYPLTGYVEMFEENSAWDGRDHLGQVVAPGTYLMHLEVSNFATGETQTDIAPIVVGVRP